MSEECRFRLEGRVNIPDNKKAEFNDIVIKILHTWGIRKTVEMILEKETVTVVDLPKIDKNGVVSFDYSIYERKKRETATFDMNTGELHVIDWGYMEYGLVINLIMTVQEAYSNGSCCLMYKDKVSDVGGYANAIEKSIGVKLSFPNRENVWDMLLHFHKADRNTSIKATHLTRTYPHGFTNFNIDQFVAAVAAEDNDFVKHKTHSIQNKNQIQEAKTYERCSYAYEMLEELLKSHNKEQIEAYLSSLLDADVTERKNMAQDEDAYAVIAEVSLYELPAILVAVYAKVLLEDFWDVWFRLSIDGYHDIITDEEEDQPDEKMNVETTEQKQEKKSSIRQKAFWMDDEDEFIGEWGDEELLFSDELKEAMHTWKENYWQLTDSEVEHLSVEQELADIITELEKVWNCRCIDIAFVEEFLAHAEDISYKKAVRLFKDILARDTKYFPELTVRQAKEWIVRNCQSEKDRVCISAYPELLLNHRHRKELFGF